MMRVLFFGPVVERVGSNELRVEYRSGMCLEDVVMQLQLRYPAAFEIVCFMAVNDHQTRDLSVPLADNDEIAFMAKFSGG